MPTRELGADLHHEQYTTVHITMPAPPSGDLDLSDDELSNAAGGVGENYGRDDFMREAMA